MKYEEAAGPGKYRSASTTTEFKRKLCVCVRAHMHASFQLPPNNKTQLLQPPPQKKKPKPGNVTRNN